MPTGACHSFYWATKGAPATPPDTPGGSGGGGYISWQVNVGVTFLFLLLLLQRF